jgi:diguanylate cyclase (GGDEF)-like protein
MPEQQLNEGREAIAVREHPAQRRVRASLAWIEAWLAAALLVYVVAAPELAHARGVGLAAVACYVLALFGLRWPGFAAADPGRTQLACAWAMALGILALMALSAGNRGDWLGGLLVLPVLATALTVGLRAGMVMLALVLCGRVLSGLLVGQSDLFTTGHVLGLLASALPVALAAYLASTVVEGAEETHERLRSLADQDGLTGVLNLQAFTRVVTAEMRRAEQRGTGFALVLVDVEGLKSANERYGHEAGNRALKALAEALQRSCRSVDLVARYGGDEFILYLSGAGAAVGRVVANRIRHNVATTTLEIGGRLHRLTVGVGVAVFPADGRHLRDLVNKAAQALDKDKDSRRPLPALRTGA